MTDLQKLIADARRNVAPYRADRDAGKYVPGIGLIFDVERLTNALEALNRENEELAKGNVLLEDELLYLKDATRPVGEEWGIGGGSRVLTADSEDTARKAAAMHASTPLVKRAVGPWLEVTDE